MLSGKQILLIVAGGIAAYKTLDLARRLRERGACVRCVLTEAGARFVTPLSMAALTGEKVHQDLFSLTDEIEMGHIRLAREADLILVAPATADLMARMGAGMANDLATAVLLATRQPILLAPSMNTAMWEHPATQANVKLLKERGCRSVGPQAGDLACGESGAGRLADVQDILAAIETHFSSGPLSGLRALVTSGPTHEPIDPVRYIANRSSGKQGHAIAKALADAGAEVTLVSGPVSLADPSGLRTLHVETAEQMLAACLGALPADIAICAAAVADWKVKAPAKDKMKKAKGAAPPALELATNPDILAILSTLKKNRPRLVIGFAAETQKVSAFAQEKLKAKGADWILANDVSEGTGTFGGDSNQVHLITHGGVESWPRMSKAEIGAELAGRIAQALKPKASKGKKA
ncbi:fused 4'-phosphopantothenoylcysteine decarboxylase; phosphopantothenoylcysteine synthetase, FMN-binding [Rhodospirillaceae bacterium LM-1]|nr:fused 4'-phosphopantothenoylcysteine decarboxylase; phosphopantothenoylcysteine synthetase, FMN-binding [Rhodospirillaceae bacterium LM-1]